MTTSLTDSTTGQVALPILTEYNLTWPGSNIFHPILNGGGAQDVTLRPAQPGKGTLVCHFPVKADAFACVQMHLFAYGAITLADTDIPEVGMDYFVAGDTTLGLNEDRKTWTVTIDVQGVSLYEQFS